MLAGFPTDINTDEMRRVYQTSYDLDLQPMTVMSALLRTEDEVFIFTSQLSVEKLCDITPFVILYILVVTF